MAGDSFDTEMNGFLQSLRRVETTTDVDEIWLSGETSLREERMDPIAVMMNSSRKAANLRANWTNVDPRSSLLEPWSP